MSIVGGTYHLGKGEGTMFPRTDSVTAFAALAALLGPVAACTPPSATRMEEHAAPGDNGVRATDMAPRIREPGDGPGAVAVLTDLTWESRYRGGPGEGTYSSACQPGWMAVGLHGRSSDQIDRIGLVCRYLERGGTLGAEDFREAVGGEGGASFLSMCPDGYAIGGLAGRSGDQVNRVQIVCDTLPGTVLFEGNPVGGTGGAAFVDVAPNRYFLTKLTGRSDARIDGLWAIYSKVDP